MAQYLIDPRGEIYREYVSGSAAITGTTTTVVVAARAGCRFICMNLIITNHDATVTTKVTIEDEDGNDLGPIISCGTNGGGIAMTGGDFPIFQGAVGKAVHALCGTDSSDTNVYMSGYYSGNME